MGLGSEASAVMLRNGAAPALGHCGGGDRRDFRGTLGERGLLEIWVGRAGGGRETQRPETGEGEEKSTPETNLTVDMPG